MPAKEINAIAKRAKISDYMKYIGQEAQLLKLRPLIFKVKIIDLVACFGRIDFVVEPLEGQGSGSASFQVGQIGLELPKM